MLGKKLGYPQDEDCLPGQLIGIHPSERQTFQYTIDLHRRKNKNSKVKTQRTSKPKPQKSPAELRAAKQRKPKRDPAPVTQRVPASPEEPVQRRHAHEEARNKTTERREYQRIRAREERQRAKNLGLCMSCPNSAIPNQNRCFMCAEKHRQSRRRSAAKSRATRAS